MKPPETLLLLGVVIALAIAGVFVLSAGPDQPGPEAPFAPIDPELGQIEPDVPAPVSADAPIPGPPSEEARVTAPLAPAPDNPGYGVLDGRVLLASEAAGKATQYTITVEEMVNPNAIERGERQPVRLTRGFKAEPNESPLYFAFDHVPFSDFGYRVTVFVPGLNGSSQIVRVTPSEWNPSVTLALTGGAPFTLRLIDQLRDPHADIDVAMMPVGAPAGRPMLRGHTDNFGTVVFENVLAGEYEARLADQAVGTVTVDPPGFVRDDVGVGAQSARLVVPKGRTVRVEVFDDAGYGLADAQVVLFAIDTVENRRFTAQTQADGVVEFKFVTPGRYQLDVRAPQRQPTSRTVEVDPAQDPASQRVRLPLL